MVDKRTLVKRSGQIKVVKGMMEKGKLIIDDDSNDKGIKKEKELVALVKNIRSKKTAIDELNKDCLLYTSPSPRDVEESRMPSSA